jgi:uncharacterized membrane protein YhaH (DUF805 family)
MNFSDAVRTCLAKSTDFKGRASRPEFWWFMLFCLLVSVMLEFVNDWLSLAFFIAMILPSLSASTRRMHDIDLSGWWQLIALIPLIGSIVLLVFLAREGTPGPNAHGAPPADTAKAA